MTVQTLPTAFGIAAMVFGIASFAWSQSSSPSVGDSENSVVPEGCFVVQSIDRFLKIQIPEEFSRFSITQRSNILEFIPPNDSSILQPAVNPFMVIRQSGPSVFQHKPRTICGAVGG